MEFPSRSIFTFWDPCGLWHVVHSNLLSLSVPTGMCDDRCTLLTTFWWQLLQVSSTVSVLSCAFSDFGACTLWQVTQPTLRDSCLPPSKLLCSLRLWQDRQISLDSA